MQLHKDLYKFVAAEGGRWKNADNVIQETLPDGTKNIRFEPTSAFATPATMGGLCDLINESIEANFCSWNP